jgi:hypothetical protein
MESIHSTLNAVWNAERESYRIQLADELLEAVKELLDKHSIVSTDPEKLAMTDVNFYAAIEKKLRGK